MLRRHAKPRDDSQSFRGSAAAPVHPHHKQRVISTGVPRRMSRNGAEKSERSNTSLSFTSTMGSVFVRSDLSASCAGRAKHLEPVSSVARDHCGQRTPVEMTFRGPRGRATRASLSCATEINTDNARLRTPVEMTSVDPENTAGGVHAPPLPFILRWDLTPCQGNGGKGRNRPLPPL
jgi:hypothetical protein